MIFVLNTGDSKTVKMKSGVVHTIPAGATSLPSDEYLVKAVKTNPELEIITQEEFFKLKKIIPTKDKINQAKEDKKKELSGKVEKSAEDKPVEDGVEGGVAVEKSTEQSGTSKKKSSSKKSTKTKEE